MDALGRKCHTKIFLQLTTPFTGAGAAATPVANGQCNTDYMTVREDFWVQKYVGMEYLTGSSACFIRLFS